MFIFQGKLSEVRTEVKNNKSVKQTTTPLHTDLTGAKIQNIFYTRFIYLYSCSEGYGQKKIIVPFLLLSTTFQYW